MRKLLLMVYKDDLIIVEDDVIIVEVDEEAFNNSWGCLHVRDDVIIVEVDEDAFNNSWGCLHVWGWCNNSWGCLWEWSNNSWQQLCILIIRTYYTLKVKQLWHNCWGHQPTFSLYFIWTQILHCFRVWYSTALNIEVDW